MKAASVRRKIAAVSRLLVGSTGPLFGTIGALILFLRRDRQVGEIVDLFERIARLESSRSLIVRVVRLDNEERDRRKG